MKQLATISLLFIMLLFTSCATLFTGTTDDVYINSNPKGANIYIDGLKVGKTPATITIKRPGFGEKEVSLEIDGYERRVFLLKKEFNAVAILNLGGILGWIIDFATGAVFKYSPRSYTIDLEPIAFNIEDLPIDEFGRLELPDSENAIHIHDSHLGLTLVFE